MRSEIIKEQNVFCYAKQATPECWDAASPDLLAVAVPLAEPE